MRAFRLHSCASRSVKARCAGRLPWARWGWRGLALTARSALPRWAAMVVAGAASCGSWPSPPADGGRRVISGGPHSTGQAKSLLNGQETTASVTCDHPWSLEVPTRQDSEIEAPNRRSTEDDAVGHTLIVTFRSIVPHGPVSDQHAVGQWRGRHAYAHVHERKHDARGTSTSTSTRGAYDAERRAARRRAARRGFCSKERPPGVTLIEGGGGDIGVTCASPLRLVLGAPDERGLGLTLGRRLSQAYGQQEGRRAH
jgi:hypothetical protein